MVLAATCGGGRGFLVGIGFGFGAVRARTPWPQSAGAGTPCGPGGPGRRAGCACRPAGVGSRDGLGCKPCASVPYRTRSSHSGSSSVSGTGQNESLSVPGTRKSGTRIRIRAIRVWLGIRGSTWHPEHGNPAHELLPGPIALPLHLYSGRCCVPPRTPHRRSPPLAHYPTLLLLGEGARLTSITVGHGWACRMA